MGNSMVSCRLSLQSIAIQVAGTRCRNHPTPRPSISPGPGQIWWKEQRSTRQPESYPQWTAHGEGIHKSEWWRLMKIIYWIMRPHHYESTFWCDHMDQIDVFCEFGNPKSRVFSSTVGHWHPKSNKDCPDGFAKADQSQTMPKLVAASWLAPRVESSTMVPSGSSGDNSRSAVKSGVVPVRINNRPTFLGASAPKWRGGLIGFLNWGTKVILQDPSVFGIFSCRNQWFLGPKSLGHVWWT